MAFLLSSERPAAAAMPFRPTTVVVRWFAQMRATRNKRLALTALLEMDEARLSDLGIERQDIIAAARATEGTMGQLLHAARARSASR